MTLKVIFGSFFDPKRSNLNVIIKSSVVHQKCIYQSYKRFEMICIKTRVDTVAARGACKVVRLHLAATWGGAALWPPVLFFLCIKCIIYQSYKRFEMICIKTRVDTANGSKKFDLRRTVQGHFVTQKGQISMQCIYSHVAHQNVGIEKSNSFNLLLWRFGWKTQ